MSCSGSHNNPVEETEKELRQERPALKEIIMAVFSKKTVYLLSLAFGAMVFVNIGYLTWMSTFLHEKYHM